MTYIVEVKREYISITDFMPINIYFYQLLTNSLICVEAVCVIN